MAGDLGRGGPHQPNGGALGPAPSAPLDFAIFVPLAVEGDVPVGLGAVLMEVGLSLPDGASVGLARLTPERLPR